ncbi:hypothetical protein AA103196_2087 [Ameyamaea chiangmaiensis NBRC 103196]|uniref:N-acetyltransferase domain-containing protein n=1 Tax=Ameyamaea chiangmaiensis TaxID=442969 RepID=A0A850P337_9PROT|nr:hypothetical protein [Ameyamaea chiangmaiensis]MBS4073647.1 hypothetical protein [Ameyamaea chiangmaiensis]NVN39085.1 hypothetical protein [Ameyamaea chiangmaiensis]GBQ68940.1 hypothetical protein AA103196_2087 [Ameyamaea chiangmaiensis NBRC 103196]
MNEQAPVIVTPVGDARALKTFIRAPRLLYRGLAGHVAALDMEQRDLLHPDHGAFFKHGRAQYFLAHRGARLVGRISAQIDPVSIAHWGRKVGMFGALDAERDPEVVAALLDAACDWLTAQGMDLAQGPYTINPTGEFGIMIEGQGEYPMIGMPWHPPGLGDLVEAAGFSAARDLLAYQMPVGPDAERAHLLPDSLKMGQGRLGTVTTRGLDRRNLARDAEILRQLYNDAWADSWGSAPLQSHEVVSLMRQLKPMLRPEHYVLVEIEGRPAGFALVVPNLYDIAGDLGGAPSPLGWVKLGTRILRHSFTSARVILLGVSAELRNTPLGALLPALVIGELMKRGRALPYRMVELGWILETNMPMRRLIERVAPEPCKRYRVYEKALSGR